MKDLTDAFDTTTVLSVWSQHGPTVLPRRLTDHLVSREIDCR